MPEQRDLSGTIQSGQGLGAGLMADNVVVEKLQELTGFPVVPGTEPPMMSFALERPLETALVPSSTSTFEGS
jgi:hypothetical protein